MDRPQGGTPGDGGEHKAACPSYPQQAYLSIIQDLKHRGTQGVILGCTEIPMLVRSEDCSIPVFDTTAIHAAAAVEWALA